jgi:hypothetical protein
MNPRQALGRGGFAAAACVACCAPPIIGALGVTAGLAATVGIFLGLAAAIAVVLVGAGWIVARSRRVRESEPVGAIPVTLAARSDADDEASSIVRP